MKRLVLIFLLAILPLQYAWSAAAAYCGHESGKSQHFGHHAHEHKDKAGVEKPIEIKKSTKIHDDCGVCHLSLQASLLPAPTPVLSPDSGAWPPQEAPPFTSFIADGPKRPDWRRLA
ncbi:cation efflux protein, CzcI family [Massilia sp. BJB1822]|uniref:cation efflux protein, CzcI family n=1 Tax=Massilia sp. BJB1822 TaxID=2744470 RepID=UPI00159486BC|nr:hypothetical protein [Massilia sp. BJB1822]